MPVLEIGGRRIEYLVRQGSSRRYTYFRFTPDMRLEVVLPRGVRDPASTLRRRSGWILKKYEEMQQSRKILDERSVMFDGRHLEIVYGPVADKEEIIPDLERGVVVMRVSDRSRTRELVRRWFLKETSRYVMKKLSELSALLPHDYKMADVREMKNWGYCTRTGRLSFSWQLIALPGPLARIYRDARADAPQGVRPLSLLQEGAGEGVPGLSSKREGTGHHLAGRALLLMTPASPYSRPEHRDL